MTEITLYYQAGKTDKSLNELITELTNETPEWYWYEPKPESLIGRQEKPPLATLIKKRQPDLPDGVEFSELMLFYPDAGISVIPDKEKKYQYFFWSENNIGETLKGSVTRQKPETIQLRNQKILKDQFGIPENTYRELPESLELTLTQYHHNNHCIAWTITGDNNETT